MDGWMNGRDRLSGGGDGTEGGERAKSGRGLCRIYDPVCIPDIPDFEREHDHGERWTWSALLEMSGGLQVQDRGLQAGLGARDSVPVDGARFIPTSPRLNHNPVEHTWNLALAVYIRYSSPVRRGVMFLLDQSPCHSRPTSVAVGRQTSCYNLCTCPLLFVTLWKTDHTNSYAHPGGAHYEYSSHATPPPRTHTHTHAHARPNPSPQPSSTIPPAHPPPSA